MRRREVGVGLARGVQTVEEGLCCEERLGVEPARAFQRAAQPDDLPHEIGPAIREGVGERFEGFAEPARPGHEAATPGAPPPRGKRHHERRHPLRRDETADENDGFRLGPVDATELRFEPGIGSRARVVLGRQRRQERLVAGASGERREPRAAPPPPLACDRARRQRRRSRPRRPRLGPPARRVERRTCRSRRAFVPSWPPAPPARRTPRGCGLPSRR